MQLHRIWVKKFGTRAEEGNLGRRSTRTFADKKSLLTAENADFAENTNEIAIPSKAEVPIAGTSAAGSDGERRLALGDGFARIFTDKKNLSSGLLGDLGGESHSQQVQHGRLHSWPGAGMRVN